MREHGTEWICSQIAQICADYAGLPDVRTMSIPDIRFFYDRLLPGILDLQRKDLEKKG